MLDTDDSTTDTPLAPTEAGPTRRRTRRTAPPAAEGQHDADTDADSPAIGDSSASADPTRRAARKAAPRKTTARKTAPRKAAPREAAPREAAPREAPGTDAPADDTVAIDTPTASKQSAPRKRSPRKVAEADLADAEADLADAADEAPRRSRRRPTKAAGPSGDAAAGAPDLAPTSGPIALAPEGQPGAAEPAHVVSEQLPSPDTVPTAPGVLFVTPSEAPVSPRTRRRAAVAATAGAPPAASPAAGSPAEVPQSASADLQDPDDIDDEEIREVAAEQATGARRRRRRGRRGRGGARRDDEVSDDVAVDGVEAGDAPDYGGDLAPAAADVTETGEGGAVEDATDDDEADAGAGRRRRRRRRRTSESNDQVDTTDDDPPNTVVHLRESRESGEPRDGRARETGDGVRGVRGSTRLEAKRQRRRDGRESGRRRPPILTESEFLARREAVDRTMAVRELGDRTQIAVLEDDVLVEHYVTRASSTSYVGNVYLGRVQNVLPSMEAAFIDIGKGRNGVLYAGEVNWDAAGLEGKSRAIEQALKSGDPVLVQVTKDPMGHKGARLTSQVSLPGRFLVYVPGGAMTGISRKLPDTERHRLKAILKKVVPEDAGVIIRTAAEGASEEDLTHDVERLRAQWDSISKKAAKTSAAPTLVYGEPDLAIRVVRDVYNEDFHRLLVQGDDAWTTISGYLADVAPDLAGRVSRHTGESDLFHDLRVDEQIVKALDRKVWLPSGGSLVIDRTEAMTVIDVNTGKFIGSGGNLEQTVTRNNLEAAEEIVRQLRLRDVGGIVVIDFIDMVLESNRDLVLRRLTECLGRDRTKHQVAEVTSLGLVQMTRKRVGEGLLEAFSETCPTCGGRGVLIHAEPVEIRRSEAPVDDKPSRRRSRRATAAESAEVVEPVANDEQRRAAATAMAAIAGVADPDIAPTSADDDTYRDRDTDLAIDIARDAERAPVDPAPRSTPPESAEPEPGPGRRRRRAASRPAGPPVAVSS